MSKVSTITALIKLKNQFLDQCQVENIINLVQCKISGLTFKLSTFRCDGKDLHCSSFRSYLKGCN